VNLALVGQLAERFDLTDTGSRDALNLVVSRMLEPPAVSMCSTMAGSSTFLVAGGKAIFMNSSVPLLGEWARGPERFIGCAQGLSTFGRSPQRKKG
jgi:hypothetical protein